jgi:F0F1-type ATP synthase epsilon subunit
MENSLLEIIVRNREAVVFEGEAVSLTSYNPRGQFDILPAHANFISLLSDRIVIRLPSGEARDIDVHNGVVRVVRNKVQVLLGIKQEAKPATTTPAETIQP